MASAKPVMLSAVQPSNRLTLGNYLGAIKNWAELQKHYECYFFAVDMHAITLRQNPAELREQTYLALATYIACGIDPDACTLFVQSHVPEHAELSWVLTCHSTMGELSRMTQFKDKSAKTGGKADGSGENIPTGLFVYPTLMAADILLYDTQLVPVGEDQKQHIELTRDLAIRTNNLYCKRLKPMEKIGDGREEEYWDKPVFRVPQVYLPPAGARIMSLQAPTQKMSKSDPDPNGAVFLSDSEEIILKKIKKAVTDSGSEITDTDDKPGVKNLLSIQMAITGHSQQELLDHYAGKQYGHLKMETAQIVATALKPIREKTHQLMSDRGQLDAILKRGALRAREKASQTLKRVYDAIGFIAS